MNETEKLLCRMKVTRSMSPKEAECFVDGTVTGMGNTPVPCQFKSATGATAKVVITDGPDTGVEIQVPLASITMMDDNKMDSIAKGMFTEGAQ